MKALQTWPSEKSVAADRVTGVPVTQLTNYLGHSCHAYFTNNGWWDSNRRLLFRGDRDNASNLFSVEIESGEISRLTDLPTGSRPGFANDVNPKKPETYFTLGNTLYAIELDTLKIRPLAAAPEGFNLHGALCGADGRYVYASLGEDLSARVYADLSASYVGMEDTFNAHPDSRVLQIDVETGVSRVIWQEHNWVGHINPSPTQPNLLTFCHEGPWNLVDHRIWCMDVNEGRPWAIRPRRDEREMIGHEYWHLDGVHVGYQVHRRDLDVSWFGAIKYDGTDPREAPCVPMPSPDHIHSNDFKLIVSDSGSSIKLYRYNGTDFDRARVLCMHDGGFFYGSHHPHPRFTTDGRQILFNSNKSGYCQLYLAPIPEDVTSLPYLSTAHDPA